jgi:hypothetical protein
MPGGKVGQYDRNGGTNQLWRLLPSGNLNEYSIQNVHSGLVLDIEGGSHNDGARVLQWNLHNGKNQKWILQFV